jgi:hypothetical protein
MLETIGKKSNGTTARLLAGALTLSLAAAAPALSLGAGAAQDHTSPAPAQGVKIPQTAGDHYELAESYRKKAVGYREEAEAHKKMLAEYSRRVAKNPKDPGENPYVRKMRLHCEKYFRAAEALAREADEMAKFHTSRARELEGK